MSTDPFRRGWVSEPDVKQRGTANILYTCFFTVYACTWTALHLNITSRSLLSRHRLFRKFQWMIIAILAPEYITLTALVQRSSTVIALTATWPLEERSRALVFYALMGGFELRFDDGTFHQLTYSEFRGLVRARFIDAPIISAEEVNDKNKGNWFTKSLALLQIGWFVIQLLARVAQHLETTPLELFTLGVVACTIISYMYWWAKPLDVNTSTPVSKGSSFEISKQRFFEPLENYRWREEILGSNCEPWFDALRAFVPSSLDRCISEQRIKGSLAPELQVGIFDDRRLPAFIGLHPSNTPQKILDLLGALPLLTQDELAEWETNYDGIMALKSVDRAVSQVDLAYWGRRRDLFTLSGTKKQGPRPPGPRPGGFWSDAFFEDRVIHTSSSLGLTFTCLVFGACHLLAWNYTFPSTTERVLWRVMSISCTALPMVLLVLDNASDWLNEKLMKTARPVLKQDNALCSLLEYLPKPTRTIAGLIFRTGMNFFKTLYSGLTSYTASQTVLCLYILQRLYLLVAIFVSLRLAPASVYKTVDWSRYIPHFG